MTAPISSTPIGSPPPSNKPEKPTRILPTERVAFKKQVELLRAYGAAFFSSAKSVTTAEVAPLADLNASTVSLCNGFFVDVGALDRTVNGFNPSPEVQQFQRAFQWNADTAGQKLAPLFRKAWFFIKLQPRLVMGPLSRGDAIQLLADAANAHPKYASQLGMLLDYLELAGLVQRDGDVLRLADEGEAPIDYAANRMALTEDAAAPQASESFRSEPVAATAATSRTPQPGVHFNIDVSVDMAELSTWSAERITAFFTGVAKVLAAKAGNTAGGS